MKTQMAPPQTFDGNYASNALQIITVNNTKITAFSPMTGLLEVDGQILDKTTAANFKNTPLCILNTPENFTRLEELQPDVAICAAANTSEFTRHQYWIKIDGDNIIVKEPNNSQNEKVYSQKEFRDIFDGILMVMVL